MAAAALVDIRGGTAEQCAEAFAMALTNLEGLVCDPVAGLVEIPCIKRNVIGSMNAVSAADMALAGIESFGVSYLTPFASNAGEQVEGHAVFRQPLPRVKQRPAALETRNRRNQK